jgi:hypothetical protein
VRLTLLMLFFFFLSFAVRSRELNHREKLTLAPFKKTQAVKGYMLDQIDPTSLPIRDFLSFQVYKQACTPLQLALKGVADASDELPDQSKTFIPLYQGCAEGVLGLSSLYVKLD